MKNLFFLLIFILISCNPLPRVEEFTDKEAEVILELPSSENRLLDSTTITSPVSDTVIAYNYLLHKVNYYRKHGVSCGDIYYPPVDTVVWDGNLESIAKYHTDYMYSNNILLHTWLDGTKFRDRLNKFNYNYLLAAENVAFGYTKETVIKAWIESPEHCANIMNSNFNKTAIVNVGNYWTQILTKNEN